MNDRLNKIKLIWQKRNKTGDKLNNLITHCIQTVPFYKNMFNQNHKIYLNNFPLTTKSMYREKKMFSSIFNEAELIWHSTSGSTGEPLKIAWDPTSIYGQNINMRILQFNKMKLKSYPNQISIILLDDNPETKDV